MKLINNCIKYSYKILINLVLIITCVMYSYLTYSYENVFETVSKPIIKAESYILIDYYTGLVLAEKNADIHYKPASLAKVMTSYVIEQAIKLGKIHQNDIVTIGKHAHYLGNILFNGSSLMFLKYGEHVFVKDLIKGIILQSGNDACVAMAEYISGNQNNFINLMNFYSKKIGLKDTIFKNVHGLDELNQYTSARDMSILGTVLIRDFPNEYSLYKEKEFTFNKIHQINRNSLLWDKFLNVDGIKTGHTNNAGYNLIVSAKKYNMRLLAVILGEKTEKNRTLESKILLNWGFKNFKTINPIIKYKKFISIPIFFGKYHTIPVGVNKDIYLTFIKNQEKKLKVMYFVNYNKMIAPIHKYEVLGSVSFVINNHILRKYPLISLKEIPRGNIFICIFDYIRLLLSKWLDQ
ncbi:serine-type D-Ala-D-Ala carboxypeptidase [Enterobacteriaceae endosymbiont of Plateumaris pusilla]|uniref:serine hydrolase n=1 Tax=Enterobacteriaceae endosymbiont of Plateumaris pusilla TaxID=2675795 RepID=UPI0014499341|nr:serine-type D-Ala-D-Ala carboxypeptidase [Enterobacteriaceae endosymbiont of Plateumaris pusilla]QJC29380.1 serine-type D-Ala-D-Ala carboxypeptidase [Enterobacteriaceae endosymbiont of Plateumaris pusilla]